MIRDNARFSGTLIPREIDPELRTLEDPDGGNMFPRSRPRSDIPGRSRRG